MYVIKLWCDCFQTPPGRTLPGALNLEHAAAPEVLGSNHPGMWNYSSQAITCWPSSTFVQSSWCSLVVGRHHDHNFLAICKLQRHSIVTVLFWQKPQQSFWKLSFSVGKRPRRNNFFFKPAKVAGWRGSAPTRIYTALHTLVSWYIVCIYLYTRTTVYIIIPYHNRTSTQELKGYSWCQNGIV